MASSGDHDRAPPGQHYGFDDYRAWSGPKPWIGFRDIYAYSARWLKVHQKAFVWMAAHESHKWFKPSAASYAAFAHLDDQRRVYAAVVADFDAGIARLFDELSAAGIADDVLTLLWSDNGPEQTSGDGDQRIAPPNDECTAVEVRGPPGCAGAACTRGAQGCELVCGTWCSVGQTGGLRGGKRSLYDGGTRSLLHVSWPGRVPIGRDDVSILSAADFLPTLLAAAGVALPDEPGRFDGEDMSRVILGAPSRARRQPILWEFDGIDKEPDWWPRHAILDWPWKLLMNGNRHSLYDLGMDAKERHDIGNDNATTRAVATQLRETLQRWDSLLPSTRECEQRFGKRRRGSRSFRRSRRRRRCSRPRRHRRRRRHRHPRRRPRRRRPRRRRRHRLLRRRSSPLCAGRAARDRPPVDRRQGLL